MIKIATPISHLFKKKEYRAKIMQLSDCLELRNMNIGFFPERQEVFHCELQPIHEFSRNDFRYLEDIKKKKKNIRLITFHAASCCDKPYIEKGIFKIGGREYTIKQMLKNARGNLSRIKQIFGHGVEMAIENNNYYLSGAYKYVTESGFLSDIVYSNNIYFLFDIAHAKITSINLRKNYDLYKKKLPLDKTIQVHICRHGLSKNGLAYDSHNHPSCKEFEEVERLLGNKNIRYLTVEYYKNIENLILSLRRLKELI